jgi:hypothetical protein
MELIINIPEDIYKASQIIDVKYEDVIQIPLEVIKSGTPLSKGHGDLKDMNDLCYKSRHGCKGNCDYLHVCNLYGAPTIIEADKELR